MVANCSLIFEPGGRSAISMIFLVFITAAINILTGIYISLVLGDHAEEDLKDLKEKKDD